MLFFGDKYSFGISSFGAVCRGTRDEILESENGQLFGSLVCQEMGLGNMEFFGSKSEYVNFIKTITLEKSKNPYQKWIADTGLKDTVCYTKNFYYTLRILRFPKNFLRFLLHTKNFYDKK